MGSVFIKTLTFIQQGHIKSIKRDSKDISNVTNYFYSNRNTIEYYFK